METKEQNIPNNTLEQQANRLKKQRRRQRVARLPVERNQ